MRHISLRVVRSSFPTFRARTTHRHTHPGSSCEDINGQLTLYRFDDDLHRLVRSKIAPGPMDGVQPSEHDGRHSIAVPAVDKPAAASTYSTYKNRTTLETMWWRHPRLPRHFQLSPIRRGSQSRRCKPPTASSDTQTVLGVKPSISRHMAAPKASQYTHWSRQQKHWDLIILWQQYPGDIVTAPEAAFKHQASAALTMVDSGLSLPLPLIVCHYTRPPCFVWSFRTPHLAALSCQSHPPSSCISPIGSSSQLAFNDSHAFIRENLSRERRARDPYVHSRS